MIETICVIVLCLIFLAVLIFMFPLVVDTVKNEIDLIKQDKKKRKRGKRK
jgi:uncharacterized membrane protein YqiK